MKSRPKLDIETIKAGKLYEVMSYDEPPIVTKENWMNYKFIVIQADGSVGKTVYNPITRQYHLRDVLFWLRQVN